MQSTSSKRTTGCGSRYLVMLALGSGLFACASVSESPNHWTEFVKVRGHDEPIPKLWVQTEAGRLAHDIVLPTTLPKPVPFDFEAARLRALTPGSGKAAVATQYWQHLCNTEAGQFIFETAEKVDGLAYMRMSPQTNESAADEDPWLYEAPGFEITEVYKEGLSIADRYIQSPWSTYLRVELPASKTGGWERISRNADGSDRDLWNEQKTWKREPVSSVTERYAVTWRGIRRPFDRENLIAGNELIVFDRTTGEPLAALRDFAVAARTGKSKYGLTWRNLGTCQNFRALYSEASGNRFYVFAPRVIAPSITPWHLTHNDRRVIELNLRKE